MLVLQAGVFPTCLDTVLCIGGPSTEGGPQPPKVLSVSFSFHWINTWAWIDKYGSPFCLLVCYMRQLKKKKMRVLSRGKKTPSRVWRGQGSVLATWTS